MTNWAAVYLYVVFVAGCIIAGWLWDKLEKSKRGRENDSCQRKGLGKAID